MTTVSGNANLVPVNAAGSHPYADAIQFGTSAGVLPVVNAHGEAGTFARIQGNGILAPVVATPASGFFRKAILANYSGETNTSAVLNRYRNFVAAYFGASNYQGVIYRVRILIGNYTGSLVILQSLKFRPPDDDFIHVTVNKSTMLLTAVISGNQNVALETFQWTLRTVQGSGFETLVTPQARSTRFENLVPHGHYVITCDINNGEGVLRSSTITVLVDSPPV